MSAPDKLVSARILILQVAESLDTTSCPCPACALTVHRNQLEYQAAVELKAMANKLHRWAMKLNGEVASDERSEP